MWKLLRRSIATTIYVSKFQSYGGTSSCLCLKWSIYLCYDKILFKLKMEQNLDMKTFTKYRIRILKYPSYSGQIEQTLAHVCSMSVNNLSKKELNCQGILFNTTYERISWVLFVFDLKVISCCKCRCQRARTQPSLCRTNIVALSFVIICITRQHCCTISYRILGFSFSNLHVFVLVVVTQSNKHTCL